VAGGEDIPVEGHNSFVEIKGTPYEECASRFTFSVHLNRAKSSSVSKKKKARSTLDAGGSLGFAAQIAAGLLDSTLFIPGGTIYRGLKGAGALKTARRCRRSGRCWRVRFKSDKRRGVLLRA
jgi:hypothetical protein